MSIAHQPPCNDVISLPGRLRELRRTLEPWVLPKERGAAAQLARVVVERLDRDLLPRTAGGTAHLVVGIVGPNNAGKSALFNALAGETISPSLPTGGATRRLVGAAHPDLLNRLEQEPTLARFALRRASVAGAGVQEALTSPGDPAELLVVVGAQLEDGVLLVDAPDFDSIAHQNRRAAEALLRVADLALVVVTRHTYQNREVVAFLEDWLRHGRPWLLVYNEALADGVTAEHAAKLAGDVGAPPVATFSAPFDLDIADGSAVLMPRALDGAPASRAPRGGTPLGGWLFDLARARELKGDALEASLGWLRDELGAAAEQARAERQRAATFLERAQAHALALGREVAGAAMPMGPFLEAFRAVLDRRPNLIQRGFRSALRKGGSLVSGLARRVRGRSEDPEPAADRRLVELERAALEPAWPPFFEALAAELPGAADGTLDSAEELEQELIPAALTPAGLRAQAALAADPEVLREFQVACEQLIEEELEGRGNEWILQLAVDLMHLVPAVAAGVVIVHTGGLGADVAVGGAGALTSMLAERLSRFLGTRVAWRARQRWSELRGARVAEVALGAALPLAYPRLQGRLDTHQELIRALEQALEDLS
jgi:50S ribosome-binding GTPase